MAHPSLIARAKARLTAEFLTSSGQVRRIAGTQGTGGYPSESLSDLGEPFACCLYSPKGSEIPEPLALLNRTVFWLAGEYPEDTRAKDVVTVDSQSFEIHDVQSDRSNQIIPRMMVSRLA